MNDTRTPPAADLVRTDIEDARLAAGQGSHGGRRRSAARSTLLLAALALLGGCASAPLTTATRADADFGVLVMAHGGGAVWDREVAKALAPIEADYPLEIAFGMADAESLQDGVRRLERRGVRRIGVVRLFVSGESWLERTAQILGTRPGAPPKPAAPAPSADHAGHHGGAAPGASAHSMAFWRIDSAAQFVLSSEGLADAPEMGAVLLTRARSLSREPAQEEVLILAHGPGDDGENQRWLQKIDQRADTVRQAMPFHRVVVETLREDWPEKRQEAEARIRRLISEARQQGRRVIVIPYRVQGFGPYAEVLAGLDYVADGQGLVPSIEVEHWVRRQAQELQKAEVRARLVP